MLSDKQIEEISKLAADYAAILDMHPFPCLTGMIGMIPCGWDERWIEMNKCREWLFDNQKSYSFRIFKDSKSGMLY